MIFILSSSKPTNTDSNEQHEVKTEELIYIVLYTQFSSYLTLHNALFFELLYFG